jgi:hypothetical protein
MPIVSSVHTLGVVQKDGRRWVVEDHADNFGTHYLHEYLAEPNADYAAILSDRAVVLSQRLIDREIVTLLGNDADPVLEHATKTLFAQVLRETYRNATREECARLAAWIIHRINSGWVTETQVRNAFGLTVGQWTTLKAKLTALRDHWLAIQAAQGE